MPPLFLRLLQLQLLLLWLVAPSSSSYSAPMSIAKPNCKDECGNVSIPYPFGIGPPNCYHNPFYEVDCRNSSNSVDHQPTPFLKHYNLEIMHIVGPTNHDIYYFASNDIDTEQFISVYIPPQNICQSDGAAVESVSFEGSPYSYSYQNQFMVSGCGGNAVFMDSKNGYILGGCSSLCDINNDTSSILDKGIRSCAGIGCCSTVFSWEGISSYRMTTTAKFNECTLAAGLINEAGFGLMKMFPVDLKWRVANMTDAFWLGDDTYACDTTSRSCRCGKFHEGNPYMPNGCQVVRECQKCKHQCHHNGLRYYCANPLLQLGPILDN